MLIADIRGTVDRIIYSLSTHLHDLISSTHWFVLAMELEATRAKLSGPRVCQRSKLAISGTMIPLMMAETNAPSHKTSGMNYARTIMMKISGGASASPV